MSVPIVCGGETLELSLAVQDTTPEWFCVLHLVFPSITAREEKANSPERLRISYVPLLNLVPLFFFFQIPRCGPTQYVGGRKAGGADFQFCAHPHTTHTTHTGEGHMKCVFFSFFPISHFLSVFPTYSPVARPVFCVFFSFFPSLSFSFSPILSFFFFLIIILNNRLFALTVIVNRI